MFVYILLGMSNNQEIAHFSNKLI